MKCIACGYEQPTEVTDKTKMCPSCGRTLQINAVELVSNPTLGFVKEVRPGQVELVTLIQKLLDTPEFHVGMYEGGCGLGKSWSYGIPAALSKKRIIIATGKKSLQDQLVNKDFKYIQEHLGLPAQYVGLKGKGNYLCGNTLARNKKLFTAAKQEKLWKQLTEWLMQNPTGDLDTFPGKIQDTPVYLCTAEECHCKNSNEHCGYQTQKALAKSAEIVITNHTLLGFDLRLGMGRVFGPYNYLIVDEAHALANAIRGAFSTPLPEKWMRKILNKLTTGQYDILFDRDALESRWQDLFHSLPDTALLGLNCFGKALQPALDSLAKLLHDMRIYISTQWDSGEDTPAATLFDRVEQHVYENGGDEGVAYTDFIILKKIYTDIAQKHDTLAQSVKADANWIFSKKSERTQLVVLHQPVCLAPLVKSSFNAIEKIILTSATMNFESLKYDLGLQPNIEVSVASPFPYKRSLMYLPKHITHPSKPQYRFDVAREIVQLVRASEGNALVLFTSIEDMHEVYAIVNDNYDLEYTIIMQGEDGGAQDVFRQFMSTNNSVLFGSKTFFEGIDVQGEKLRLVIIPKIPFAPVGDALNEAKKQLMGPQAHWKLYYSEMLTNIQQAVGRLIRTQEDRGVIALLDTRIWVGKNKDIDPHDIGTAKPWTGYGCQIVRALPFRDNYTYRFELVSRYLQSLAKR